MKYLILIVGLCCCQWAVADEPPPPSSEDMGIVIHLPVESDVKPTPVVPTDPDAVPVLPLDRVLVVESDVELFVLQVPDADLLEVVRVAGETGKDKPVVGKFADGPGRMQARVFQRAYVYTLFPTGGPGNTELVFVPAGVTNEASIVRQLLVIGAGPQPPPINPPKPIDPPTPPTPTAALLSVALVDDVLRIKPDTAIVIASKQWADLAVGPHKVRVYDKGTQEPEGLKAIKAAGTIPLPVLVVWDQEKGTVLHVGPMVADTAALTTLVSKLTGE